jgi:hypothetical protein
MSATAVAVRERPILFRAAMVQAVMDGRKTKTRRIAKPVRRFEHYSIPKYGMPYAADPGSVWWHSAETERVGCLQECPYGKPGDRLWVKETFSVTCREVYPCPTAWYRADFAEFDDPARNQREHTCPEEYRDDTSVKFGMWADCFACDLIRGHKFRWKPSIFMSRRDSRITLEITDVRVERLQDISEVDAQSEGVEACTAGTSEDGPVKTYRTGFVRIWRDINGPDSWSQNPPVRVISFQRVA